MRTMNIPMATCGLIVLVGLCAPAGAQNPPTDHPFALVNVIDLFNFFNITVDPNVPFNGEQGPPPNWNQYKADPRLGTNPSAVTVDGNRLWIGGFYNGPNWENGGQSARLAWYAAVGVGEVTNILTTSGFDGSTIKYIPTINVGPTIYNTESITGMDYDPILKRVYIAYDDPYDFYCDPIFCFLPPGTTSQEPSYIAAIDADPNSPTYKQFIWKLDDPFYPPANPGIDPGDRFYGGVAVDPLDPTRLWVSMIGDPRNSTSTWGFRGINVLNPTQPALRLNIKNTDPATTACYATFYRQIGFDAVSGDMFVRNANAVEWIERDPRGTIAPFKPYALFIIEPESGGNGICNTTAQGDDVQLVALGAPATPGQNLIGAGPNGIIDTTPGGDDRPSRLGLVNARPIGNKSWPNGPGENCNDAPLTGFEFGPFGQGQGLAVVSATNVEGLSYDLVVGNNRKTFGGNQLKDIRVHTIDGVPVSQLELPCSPPASLSSGLAIYDLDYDEASGTLVVVEMENRKAYVFKTQLTGGPAWPRYDYTRNQRVDLADFAGFQVCFTGSENPAGLSLNCQRVNSDSDCDVDMVDWNRFFGVWESQF